MLLNWLYIQVYICIAQTRAILLWLKYSHVFSSDSFTYWKQINQDVLNTVDLICKTWIVFRQQSILLNNRYWVINHINAEHGHFDLKKEKRDEKSLLKLKWKLKWKYYTWKLYWSVIYQFNSMFRLAKHFLIERFIHVCTYSASYVHINCIDFKSGYLIKCIKKHWFICTYRAFNVNFNCIDFKSGIFF